jgi:YD repeat-containing protein
MLAENDPCRELARELENMIKRGDARLNGKISKVMKETKDKSEYPKLLLHTGNILSDINEIYLYLFSDPRQRQRRSSDPYEGLNSSGYNQQFNIEDFMQEELEYDEDGKVIHKTDYDDEKVSYDKSKSRRFADDSEDELPGKLDMNAIATRFGERRGAIRPTRFKNGKPIKQMGRRVKAQREESRSRSRGRKPKRKRRRESSEESGYDDRDDYDNDRYPDGGNDLDNYYAREARN